MECLERRLLLSVCLYGCVYKIGYIDCVHAEGIACHNTSEYTTICGTCSAKGSNYAGHTKDSFARDSVYSRPVYIGCKFGVRARIYMASHKPNTGPLVRSVVVSCCMVC